MAYICYLSGIHVACTYFAVVWEITVADFLFLINVCSNVESVCDNYGFSGKFRTATQLYS